MGLGDTLGVLPVECGGTGKTSSAEMVNSLRIPEYVTFRFSNTGDVTLKSWVTADAGLSLLFEDQNTAYPFEPFWNIDDEGNLHITEGLYAFKSGLRVEIVDAKNCSGYIINPIFSIGMDTYTAKTFNSNEAVLYREGGIVLSSLKEDNKGMKNGMVLGSETPESAWGLSKNYSGNLMCTAASGYWSDDNGSRNYALFPVSTNGARIRLYTISRSGSSGETNLMTIKASGELQLKKIM